MENIWFFVLFGIDLSIMTRKMKKNGIKTSQSHDRENSLL